MERCFSMPRQTAEELRAFLEEQVEKMLACKPDMRDAMGRALIAQVSHMSLRVQKVAFNELMGLFREHEMYECATQAGTQVMQAFRQSGELLSRDYAITMLNYANALCAAGEYDQSRSMYDQAKSMLLTVCPEDKGLLASYYNNVSILFSALHRNEDARDAAMQAITLVEDLGDDVKAATSSINLARIYVEMGQLQDALSLCKKADSLLCGDSPVNYHYGAILAFYGQVLDLNGYHDQAARTYEKALAVMAEYHIEDTTTADEVRRALRTYYEGDRPYFNGLTLARRYYEDFGKQALEKNCADLMKKIAVGYKGEGSDCLGLDDAASQDHDFGGGFVIFVPDNMAEEEMARLQTVYDNLPKTYYGIQRQTSKETEGRVGVVKISDFYHRIMKNGETMPYNDYASWLMISSETLAIFSGGEMYHDPSGMLRDCRKLEHGYPLPVQMKLIAQACGEMYQMGFYKYTRTMQKRGDLATAKLCVASFCENAYRVLLLLENQYPPYTLLLKRACQKLPDTEDILKRIDKTLTFPSIPVTPYVANNDPVFIYMREIAGDLTNRILKKFGMTADTHLPRHFDFMDVAEALSKEADKNRSQIRLSKEIAELEFAEMDKVQNAGGRAGCQDDWTTFSIMRQCQYRFWPVDLLEDWIAYFKEQSAAGRNLVAEKYARMMEKTNPELFAPWAEKLPKLSTEFVQMREAIIEIQLVWLDAFTEKYPRLAARSRRPRTENDTPQETSYETYLRGELSEYTPDILYRYGRWIVKLYDQKKNLTTMTMEETVHAYGYATLEDAEKALK